MTTEPRAALDRLIAALEAHLQAASRRRGETDPAVVAAFDTLADAFTAYDDALFSAFDETTPFVLYDDEDDDGDDEDDDEEDDFEPDDVLDDATDDEDDDGEEDEPADRTGPDGQSAGSDDLAVQLDLDPDTAAVGRHRSG
jgi:hypothetical protein